MLCDAYTVRTDAVCVLCVCLRYKLSVSQSRLQRAVASIVLHKCVVAKVLLLCACTYCLLQTHMVQVLSREERVRSKLLSPIGVAEQVYFIISIHRMNIRMQAVV